VFVLRVNKNKFPQPERPHVFEFPAALMKEGAPEEQFHNQEETPSVLCGFDTRRGSPHHYRADREKGPRSAFSRRHLDGAGPPAPRRVASGAQARSRSVNGTQTAVTPAATGSLFVPPVEHPKIFSRIAAWAEAFLPPSPEPLELNPSAVDSYRKCPQKYLFAYLWSLQEAPRLLSPSGA